MYEKKHESRARENNEDDNEDSGSCSRYVAFFLVNEWTNQTATMDAIKKKMQGMKLEKDNAMDRALLCEQQARDANARAEKVNV